MISGFPVVISRVNHTAKKKYNKNLANNDDTHTAGSRSWKEKKNHTEREKDIIFEDYAEHLLQ